MSQTSEIKLLKRFDQNVEITGNLTVSGTLTGGADTNYYLDGITKSGNTLTFSVNGATNQTYTFGSNAFTSYTDHSTQGYLTDITTQTDPKYLRSNADDTTSGNITISKASAFINIGYSSGPHGINFYDQDGSTLKWGFYYRTTPDTITFETGGSSTKFTLDTSGNLTVTGTLSASGYNKSNWDTAYGWGNHASAGYLTSSSSIDADTLDSLNSTQFLRSDASDTFTGTLTLNHDTFGAGLVLHRNHSGNAASITFKNNSGQAGILYATYADTTLRWRDGTTTNAYEIWHEGNDGSGSGLDADTLDGQHASAFLTSLPSHTHDDRYYTESEIQTYFNRGYINSHGASNLAVGWYTIATNTGNRALGEFQIWDTASSDHQSVLFNASHHYGNDSSNDITVLANSRFSGTNFRYIRIKDGGTYDGAALQVYIDAATNSVNVAIVGGNAQINGWVIKDWVPDATDPGDLSNYSSFGVRCQVDLDLVISGGIITTGEIYSGGETSQFRVLNTGDEGSGNGLDADTVDGIQAGSFLRSDADDSYSGEIIASGTDWYLWGLGARGASSGEYGIGNRSNDSYRQLTFHVPNQAAYSSSGTIPSFGWYSNGAVQLMKLDSDSGNLWVKGTGEFAGAVRITESGTAQYLLIGNQDSGGVNKPAMVRGVNGYISLGYGNSWSGEGGTFTSQVTLGSGTVDFNSNNITGVTDLYVADQIIHTGDTNTYLQFHNADQFRIVIAGSEVTEWGNNYMKMRDNDTIRLGEGSDFRMYHTGSDTIFRNYNHAAGNIYWQGEDTEGTNQALVYMHCDSSRTWVRLFENGEERLRTIDGGVRVTGRLEFDDSYTKLLKGSSNALNITTNSGYVEIGPMNTSWCHFSTDRAGNYFNKKVIVNGGTIGSYDEDLSLVRANGTADRILIRSTSIGFFLDSAEDMRLENDGDLHVEGDIIAYSSTISDIRLKDEVKTIDNALGKIKSLRGVEYVWNKGHREGQKDLGLIAQEVEEVLPEIVREKKMPLIDDSEEKYKTVDYEKVVGVLIEAVKELSNKVEELENKLNVTDV